MTKDDKKSLGPVSIVKDVFNTDKKIGELNGKWSVMLKMMVLSSTVIIPLLLTWGVWVTTNIFSTQHHIRDTETFRQRIVDVEKALTVTPERINENAESLDDMKKELKETTLRNNQDHQSIMVQLSKIQTQLEGIRENQK
jgi:hypothetical protein